VTGAAGSAVSAVLDEIQARACEAPERIAITRPDSAPVSYGDLVERIEAMAGRIERVAPPGAVVALLLPNGPDLACAFCACLSAGRIVFPLHPATPAAEIETLRARCGMCALVRPDPEPGGRSPQLSPLEPVPCADPVRMGGGLILQTSGTTAQPKLVLRDRASLGAVGANVRDAANLSPGDTVLAAIPLYHSYGVENGLLAPLMAGAGVLALDGFDLAAAARALSSGGATVFPGAPFMFDALSRVAPAGGISLRLAYSAGSPLPAGVAERFARAWGTGAGQLYGASDIGSVTFNDPASPGFDPMSVGVPMRGVSVRIVDEAGAPLPPSAEGQVAVRAPSMLTRYVDGAPVPLADDHFLTGDLGRLDDRGRLTITGRLTLLIDVGGVKVNPVEVEAALGEHPAIARCIVAPMRMSETVTRLRAVYEPRAGAACAPEELRTFLRQRLAPHKIPRVFEACALPVSGAGKVLRREVEAL
jgi:acyl-CoA synthetase (AMP-forming)/AMP-acid ligase II